MTGPNADRDLLFGLVALQVGLIDQDQLVAAFRGWTRDRSRPLAQYLTDRDALDPEQRAGVEAMVGLHLKKYGGDAQRSLAAVAAGRSTRESLAALGDPAIEQTLTQLATPPPDADPDRTASFAVGTATSGGLRFRVLRPHARGGLGAVFVALDAELNREVALKQILDDHADDPNSRARFLLEAEITGGLEHPGIVPVYGLGAYSDGRPYYAMRFIRGDSLREAIDRFRADESLGKDPGRRTLAMRQLLRRFVDVCDAIEYAHSRGVLHRDLKPGNIIVGKHGETLVVDWGLAKAMGRPEPGVDSGERALVPSSASGSAETLPGSALGTPSYMSPEQAEGHLDRLGARSDVYSLGATLYYLLTGRPPFEGDLHEVIRAVQRGDVRPPRQLDASIDRALEAVCLKAMRHRPEDRYASPRALAEDVERWMADEPVSAWREPLSRRARRWANRNRPAVTAAAAALVAGVVGLSLVLAVQTRAKAQIAAALGRETAAHTALATANDELARSKAAVLARYDLAVEAIKTFHTGVSEDFLLKEAKFKALRDRLLKSAAEFYGKLGALLGRETDVASRRALAASNFELAELTGKVGRTEAALSAHRSVLAARDALAAGPGAGAAETAELGRSLNAVARLLEATGRTEEAVATYRRAESLLSGPAASDPAARAALGACRSNLGWRLHATGRSDEGLAVLRQARSDQEAPAAAPGADADARRELAETVNRIGLLMEGTGRVGEAEAEFRTALAIRRELAEEHPAVIQLRSDLASSHNILGVILEETGRAGEVEAEFRAALAIRRELAEEHPAVTQLRSQLAASHNNLGLILSGAGRAGEAEAEYRAALAIHAKLAEEDPAVTQFRSQLAHSHDGLGALLLGMGRAVEAEAEYRAALELFLRLAADNPRAAPYRDNVANLESDLSVVLRRQGRPTEALDRAGRAVAAREVLVKERPDRPPYRSGLAGSVVDRALARRALGDTAGAAADLRRAVALYGALPSRTGDDWFFSALPHAALAGLAGSGLPADAASSEARTAMALLHKAVAMGYRTFDFYRTEDALDPLRDRDDFRRLMMDLAFPAEPFARGD